MKKYLILLAAVICLSNIKCTQPASDEIPAWLNNLILKYQSEPVGNPPQSIWQYTYNGRKVYFVPQQCCDQYSVLYDENGNVLCAPDGGFTGRGDGKCSDFFAVRKDEKLIWQDKRIR